MRCFIIVRRSHYSAAFLALALLASAGLAQQPSDQAAFPPPAASPAHASQQALPATAPAGADAQAAKEMARAVTRMAEMCEMMMKKEKAALPYLGAAAVTLGALLFTVLVLLVVLQVQWITYWSRLLKTQRANNGLET